jgi:hypothetical protein
VLVPVTCVPEQQPLYQYVVGAAVVVVAGAAVDVVVGAGVVQVGQAGVTVPTVHV